MKKVTKSIVAVFAIATTLVSCTKDNNTTSTSADALLGKWEATSATLHSPGDADTTVDPNDPCTVKAYIDLKTAGIAEIGDLDADTCEITKVAGIWNKTGNTMEMTRQGEAKETTTIVSVTATTLVTKTAITDSAYPAGSYMQATFTKKQ